MARFLAGRLLATLPVMLVVATIVFLLLRLAPGDPAAILAGDAASPEQIASIRARLGLDQPIIQQYGRWIFGILTQWDFGQSVLNQQDVSAIIRQRLPNTLLIGLPSIVLGIVLGLPIGVLGAVRRGSWLDQTLSLVVNAFLSTPRFLVAIFGVLILALKLRLIPLQGYTPPWVDFGAYVHKALWPVFVNSIYVFAVVARYTRSNLLEVLGEDYIRTARAHGLGPMAVLVRHALPNAAVPIVTVIGLGIAVLIGGVVVTESVFAIPGLGRLTVDAVLARDYPTVQAVILLFSMVYVLVNLLIDIAYTALDPRIRY